MTYAGAGSLARKQIEELGHQGETRRGFTIEELEALKTRIRYCPSLYFGEQTFLGELIDDEIEFMKGLGGLNDTRRTD